MPLPCMCCLCHAARRAEPARQPRGLLQTGTLLWLLCVTHCECCLRLHFCYSVFGAGIAMLRSIVSCCPHLCSCCCMKRVSAARWARVVPACCASTVVSSDFPPSGQRARLARQARALGALLPGARRLQVSLRARGWLAVLVRHRISRCSVLFVAIFAARLTTRAVCTRSAAASRCA